MAGQKKQRCQHNEDTKQDEKSGTRFEHHEGTNRVTHELLASLTEWGFKTWSKTHYAIRDTGDLYRSSSADCAARLRAKIAPAFSSNAFKLASRIAEITTTSEASGSARLTAEASPSWSSKSALFKAKITGMSASCSSTNILLTD